MSLLASPTTCGSVGLVEQVVSLAELDSLIAALIAAEYHRIHLKANAYADALLASRSDAVAAPSERTQAA
jgi:hypothetical protein